MTTISKDKCYRLRNGFEYRMLCDDAGGVRPIVGLARKQPTDDWETLRNDANGFHLGGGVESAFDLIEVNPPIKFKGWALLYRESDGRLIIGYPHATKAEAYRGARFFQTPIACIPINIDCAEGEGL